MKIKDLDKFLTLEESYKIRKKEKNQAKKNKGEEWVKNSKKPMQKRIWKHQ